MSVGTKERGAAAMAAWTKAIETGDTSDIVEMMSDDLVFAIPMALPDWSGEQHGPGRFAELIDFEKSEIHEGMTVEHVARFHSEDGTCAQVVCRARSRDTGEEFTSPLMVSFRFAEDGRIADLREWTWNLQPEAAARQAGLID